MRYTGSCHCGQTGFAVEGDLSEVVECNCSICSKKGALLWRVAASQFHLLTPSAGMGTYRFGKKKIQHHFCPCCGIHLYAEGAGQDGAPLVVVNVRCLEGIDPSTYPVRHFDGHSL